MNFPIEIEEMILSYLSLEDLYPIHKTTRNFFIIFLQKSKENFEKIFWNYDKMKFLIQPELSNKILSPYDILQLNNFRKDQNVEFITISKCFYDKELIENRFPIEMENYVQKSKLTWIFVLKKNFFQIHGNLKSNSRRSFNIYINFQDILKDNHEYHLEFDDEEDNVLIYVTFTVQFETKDLIKFIYEKFILDLSR